MVVTRLTMHLFLVPFAFLSHVFLPLPELPALTSQINYLYAAPDLRVCFWGTQTETSRPSQILVVMVPLSSLSGGHNAGPLFCHTHTHKIPYHTSLPPPIVSLETSSPNSNPQDPTHPTNQPEPRGKGLRASGNSQSNLPETDPVPAG